MSVFQAGVDANFVLTFLQRQHFIMGQTESPVFLVIRSSIGNPIWTVRNRKQMMSQFAQRHDRAYRHTVVHHMQIAILEVHDALPTRSFDVSITNIPLLRYGPIEDSSSGWYLEGLHGNTVVDPCQGLA